MALTILSSCSPDEVTEVKETSLPAEQLISSITEVYSTFDILDDFISSSDLLFKKDEQLIPSSVDVVITDSNFLDGDGVSFYLDFGSVGSAEPHGVLCKDNKYRAGKIYVTISSPYADESSLSVHFDSYEPFYSGDGKLMNAFTGNLTIYKDREDYEIFTNDLKIEDTTSSITFQCDNRLRKTENPGAGILNDVVEIDGSFTILSNGGKYVAEISNDLIKKYTSGCVKNIVEGELKIEVEQSASDISADFDPYGDAACDNLVEITINGKSFIHQY